MSVTELDSHAAVAGKDCTIISTSGQYANVTPFSSDLPMMERVEKEMLLWHMIVRIRGELSYSLCGIH